MAAGWAGMFSARMRWTDGAYLSVVSFGTGGWCGGHDGMTVLMDFNNPA